MNNLNPNSLRLAIAHTPSTQRHFANELQRLFGVFEIPTNANGDPIDASGQLILRDLDGRPKPTDIEMTECPAGMVTAAQLAEKYDMDQAYMMDYLQAWRFRHGDPIEGYYRYHSPRPCGAVQPLAIAYYDPATFHAFLLDLMPKESGARRMLANVGIGKYKKLRGGRRAVSA